MALKSPREERSIKHTFHYITIQSFTVHNSFCPVAGCINVLIFYLMSTLFSSIKWKGREGYQRCVSRVSACSQMLLTEGIGQTTTRETACQIRNRLTPLLTRKQRLQKGLQKVNIWFKEQRKSENCFEKGPGRILPEKKYLGLLCPLSYPHAFWKEVTQHFASSTLAFWKYMPAYFPAHVELNFLCSTCPIASFALQFGDFVLICTN